MFTLHLFYCIANERLWLFDQGCEWRDASLQIATSDPSGKMAEDCNGRYRKNKIFCVKLISLETHLQVVLAPNLRLCCLAAEVNMKYIFNVDY